MDHTKADINRLESKVAALTRDIEKVASVIRGKSSQVIMVPTGIAGWGEQIKVIGSRMGNVPLEDTSAPFQASYADGKISLLGGYWQQGATGAWTEIAATEETDGTHAYLKIGHGTDLTYAWASIEILTEAVADVIERESTYPYTVTASHVLLAEVVDGKIIQRRHGNFTLGIWQIDGNVTYWPETVGGSIP